MLHRRLRVFLVCLITIWLLLNVRGCLLILQEENRLPRVFQMGNIHLTPGLDQTGVKCIFSQTLIWESIDLRKIGQEVSVVI